MSKRYPVEVQWIDSMQHNGWHKYKPSSMRCRSVGMLYEKTKDRVVLALNEGEHCCGDYMEIPMISVKKIKRLK